MDPFLRAAIRQSPLEADEERELARRSRQGDQDARDALITAGLRLVVLRARMRGCRGEELRDAVQSGTVGLIRAIDRFDPDRGARLATYAWHWIGAEMGRTGRCDLPLDGVDVPAASSLGDDVDLLEGLPDDHAAVLRLRFGLGPDADVAMSRRAVGETLGLTVAQVRSIESKAMRQLRGRLAKVVDRAPRHRGADPP